MQRRRLKHLPREGLEVQVCVFKLRGCCCALVFHFQSCGWKALLLPSRSWTATAVVRQSTAPKTPSHLPNRKLNRMSLRHSQFGSVLLHLV